MRLLVPRHALTTRITHWITVVAFLVLLSSGMQIFNAHPALYWGEASRFDQPWLSGFRFPHALTLPGYQSLAEGRRWHLFFAWLLVLNGLAYVLFGVLNRHFKNDLAIGDGEWKTIPREIAAHARLDFPKGEPARRYNILQKLAYLGVIFGLFPLVILAGMTLSPALDALLPLSELFGGRQTARSLHFLAAAGLVLFLFAHLLMVVASGTWNNLRSMITGRYAIDIPDANAPQDPLRDDA